MSKAAPSSMTGSVAVTLLSALTRPVTSTNLLCGMKPPGPTETMTLPLFCGERAGEGARARTG
jgi:hypothetical protein